MIKPLGFVLIAALGASFVQAQTPAPATPAAAASPAVAPAAAGPSWVLTPSFVSTYMFRGMKVNGLSFQPSVELDVGNAMVGVWASFPLDDKTPGVSDPEVDPYFTYKVPVNDALSLLPGFSFYTYPRADTSVGSYKMTFEPYVSASYTVGAVTLAPKLYYDFVLDGATYEFTASSALPLAELGTELDFTATAGTYLWRDVVKGGSPQTKNWGDYWLVGVSVPYELTKTAKVSLGYAYTKGSNNYYKTGPAGKTANPTAVGRGVVTLSATISF
jgi:uncharacterized protein (TIGR02001 family)